MTKAGAGRKRAKKARERNPYDATDVLDSVLVDPEFDKVEQVDLEELVGRGRGASNYD